MWYVQHKIHERSRNLCDVYYIDTKCDVYDMF